MPAALTIGDFSRMTHLSAKTLRHYHRVGLLEPATVDPDNGYRYYTTEQVATAQVIRRFRDLDMPVDEVRSVLAAGDPAERNRLIATHLDRLEDRLTQTQAAVTSLRHLLGATDAPVPIPVTLRSVPATVALAVSATVEAQAIGSWWTGAIEELYVVVRTRHLEPTGPAGGLYGTALFEDDRGAATVFVPVADPPADAIGRVHALEVPAADLAVAVHEGPELDIDLAYAAVGSYVAERAIGVDGPVREHYLVTERDTPDERAWRTEIGWPIFRTTSP